MVSSPALAATEVAEEATEDTSVKRVDFWFSCSRNSPMGQNKRPEQIPTIQTFKPKLPGSEPRVGAAVGGKYIIIIFFFKFSQQMDNGI